MSTTDIAVVVPTYRRPDRAERMIAALEAQTLPVERFEVVVVDDCSGDGTAERLRARVAASLLAARVLSTPTNGGPAVARNLGWQSTSAPLVAFVDDDCVPAPDWLAAGLEALAADEHLGVVQGHTRRPDFATLGDWTLWREVTGPTPFFEGCNIFYRRAALAQAGGFDEEIAWYGEDTAAGWAVVDAGWGRGFAPAAVAFHDVEERGVRWHIRNGYFESHLVELAARHPQFRREAFWRPWAFRRENAACTAAIVGLALGMRWRPALLLAVPYLRWRRPPPGHGRPFALMAERAAVDVAQAAGLLVGSIRNGILVL